MCTVHLLHPETGVAIALVGCPASFPPAVMANKSNARQVRMRQRRDLIHDLLSRCTCYGPLTDDALKAIVCIVTNIIAIEKKLDPIELPDRENNFDRFRSFCQTNGVDVSAVEIVSKGDKDFGLNAKIDLQEDDLILCIPRRIILTAEELPDDAAFREFATQDPLLKEMPNLVLVMILIREFCETDSFWKPYIDILPSSYANPLYLGYDALLSLKPSSTFQESGKLFRSIARQYSYFWTQMNSSKSAASHLSFKNLFTFELYRWAVCTVMTRQNLIPSSDGKSQVNALIPLWDLCNHEMGKFSTDYSVEKDAIVCYAMQKFSIGTEIKIFYGRRSNEEFLVHNGFVHNENPYNYLTLNLGISKNDKLAEMRTDLCAKTGIPASGKFSLMHKHSGMDPDLLCFLRIFHMDAGLFLSEAFSYLTAIPPKIDQLERWLEQGDVKPLKDPESENFAVLDNKVNDFLRVRASLLRQTYPSDENVEKIPNPHIRRLIVGEKEILQSHVL